MTYDGYVGAYYPKPVVLYEFSTGITAPGNSSGGRLVQNDIENAMRIMVTRNTQKDKLHRQIDRIISKRLKRGKKKLDIFFEKGRLVYAIKFRLFPKMTCVPQYDNGVEK